MTLGFMQAHLLAERITSAWANILKSKSEQPWKTVFDFQIHELDPSESFLIHWRQE